MPSASATLNASPGVKPIIGCLYVVFVNERETVAYVTNVTAAKPTVAAEVFDHERPHRWDRIVIPNACILRPLTLEEPLVAVVAEHLPTIRERTLESAEKTVRRLHPTPAGGHYTTCSQKPSSKLPSSDSSGSSQRSKSGGGNESRKKCLAQSLEKAAISLSKAKAKITTGTDTNSSGQSLPGPRFKKFLTSPQTAALLGCSVKRTLKRLRQSGVFPGAYRDGIGWHYPIDEVKAFKRERDLLAKPQTSAQRPTSELGASEPPALDSDSHN